MRLVGTSIPGAPDPAWPQGWSRAGQAWVSGSANQAQPDPSSKAGACQREIGTQTGILFNALKSQSGTLPSCFRRGMAAESNHAKPLRTADPCPGPGSRHVAHAFPAWRGHGFHQTPSLYNTGVFCVLPHLPQLLHVIKYDIKYKSDYRYKLPYNREFYLTPIERYRIFLYLHASSNNQSQVRRR